MYKFATIVCCVLFLTSCQTDALDSEDNQTITTKSAVKVMPVSQINTSIEQSFKNGERFSWKTASQDLLWSATVHGQGVLTIGYGQDNERYRTSENPRLTSTKQDIINLVINSEGRKKSEVVLREEAVLNVIHVLVKDPNTLMLLRELDDIRYIEPSGYDLFKPTETATRSSSGCGEDGSTIYNNDMSDISPGAQMSWNYKRHKIHRAWNKSTGAGVTVGVIDTGVSESQSLMGSMFNSGDSSGRTVELYGTFIDSPWPWSTNYDGPYDLCGHGTSMTATVAAPRNTINMPTGVAYNASLVSYRGTEDVLLDDYHEKLGVSDALIALGNNSDVQIISMSIGSPLGIGNVEDALIYAYDQGKLIFAAGGTSTELTNWYPVIFPAYLPQAIAVTGVTDNKLSYDQCAACHDGAEIEFTIMMERKNNSSRHAAVAGFSDGLYDYIGGSSVATATTAGIAALVWSKFPEFTREQVLQKMRESSDLYPSRDANFGYGNINAFKAVR
ncbi:MAG: S8 family serine peptidase [Gilvibacter sp.]